MSYKRIIFNLVISTAYLCPKQQYTKLDIGYVMFCKEDYTAIPIAAIEHRAFMKGINNEKKPSLSGAKSRGRIFRLNFCQSTVAVRWCKRTKNSIFQTILPKSVTNSQVMIDNEYTIIRSEGQVNDFLRKNGLGMLPREKPVLQLVHLCEWVELLHTTHQLVIITSQYFFQEGIGKL